MTALKTFRLIMKEIVPMKLTLFSATVALLFCFECETAKNKDFIGSAIVECQTYQIATTSQGAILAAYKEEGMSVSAHELVALIDTVPLILKLNELNAAQAQLSQTVASKKAEVASQDFDVKGVEREYRRITDLVDKGALPSQQKDNLQTQADAAKLRIKAGQLTLESLYKQEKTVQTQEAQLRDQIDRCYVKAPCNGVILTRYKNPGEVALPGNPIYEIGKYDTMEIDFYVPQPMLPQFSLGKTVRIRIDDAAETRKNKEIFLIAVISWISNDAEFSPKNIQTRESRNELVFKIRALAPNKDGLLKRGLPVEVWK